MPEWNNDLTLHTFNLPSLFEENCGRLSADAFKALGEIIRNEKAPAAARVAAAKDVLDRTERAIERAKPLDERDVSDLSYGDMAEIVRRLELKLAGARAEDAVIVPRLGNNTEPDQ